MVFLQNQLGLQQLKLQSYWAQLIPQNKFFVLICQLVRRRARVGRINVQMGRLGIIEGRDEKLFFGFLG
jgi:hypothetical protein